MEKEKMTPETAKRKKHFLFLLPFAFCLLTFLTGCVQYDLGLTFKNTNSGELVQHINLKEKFAEFSKATVDQWLNSIESRATQLRGKTERISDNELVVTIPFNNGEELAEKFNQFFNPIDEKKAEAVNSNYPDLPKINSHLTLNQGNYLLVVRNKLSYDLDLRSLAVISPQGNVVINADSLFQLDFRLNTPWGVSTAANGENAIEPANLANGHPLVWTLKPGEINHLEAVFWLPSPLGIGAVAIALFVGAGILIKYGVAKPKVKAARG
ncbi:MULTISPECIES: DUF3153 domain-containing protein [Aerosakkonema]|uniref:DUF3153 domain-containing protein n=1 Tax=Aerosakkonema TaxID=1246629 RepID=UPI0035BB22CA